MGNEHIIRPEAPVLVAEQRQQEGPAKLRVRTPERVAGRAALEGKQVHEHRLATVEQDIVRRSVLQPPTFLQALLRQIQRQGRRRVEHLGGPLGGIAGERHALVLEDGRHLAPDQGPAQPRIGLQTSDLRLIQPPRRHQIALRQEPLGHFGAEKRLDRLQTVGVHHPQDSATEGEAAAVRIAEGGTQTHAFAEPPGGLLPSTAAASFLNGLVTNRYRALRTFFT